MPDRPEAPHAVVTGATGLVGEVCARALVEAGCTLSVLGRRRHALEATASALSTGDGPEPDVVEVDLATAETFRPPASWTGRRLVFVNAAAVFGPLGPFVRTDPEAWRQAQLINFLGPAMIIRALLPIMVGTGWGRVVQVSSAAARARPAPYVSAYTVSKAALDATLARLATELVGTGVTVCALHPGDLDSAMRDDIATQAATDPALSSWSAWADRTAAHGDDPEVAARWVAALLDDATAARAHGTFAWPQRGGETEPL